MASPESPDLCLTSPRSDLEPVRSNATLEPSLRWFMLVRAALLVYVTGLSAGWPQTNTEVQNG